MPKVPYEMGNIKRCVCGRCPVQEKSQCVLEKKHKMEKVMKNTDVTDPPKPEDVPGIYCGAGKAVCGDIDTNQMCICGSCPVWEEYDLPHGTPLGYFCRDGMAE